MNLIDRKNEAAPILPYVRMSHDISQRFQLNCASSASPFAQGRITVELEITETRYGTVLLRLSL